MGWRCGASLAIKLNRVGDISVTILTIVCALTFLGCASAVVVSVLRHRAEAKRWSRNLVPTEEEL